MRSVYHLQMRFAILEIDVYWHLDEFRMKRLVGQDQAIFQKIG